MGFVAHIPHYLAQLDYPAGVGVAARARRARGRVAVDLTDLREAARARDEEITTYLAANDEVAEVVQALEQQYDAFARAEQEGSSLLADDEPIPTGEEIGRQFEQFLAGLDTPEGDSLMPSSAAELVELLDIETLDTDLFRGRSPDTDRQRVFGGQVAAQALIAAIRTVARPASTCTRCTPTSCAPATPRSRSSTTPSGSATAARSRPGGWWRASTATRSST